MRDAFAVSPFASYAERFFWSCAADPKSGGPHRRGPGDTGGRRRGKVRPRKARREVGGDRCPRSSAFDSEELTLEFGILGSPLIWLVLASAAVVACGRDFATTPHTEPQPDFDLVRVEDNALPAFDSGDSVDLQGLVEYREIYLERGTLTLTLEQGSPRFETLLHYAWYAVTIDESGQRHLDPRGLLDIRDRGSVEFDAWGKLRLRSDVSGAEHIATPTNGGYSVLYRQVAITQPLTLFFGPRAR